MSALLAIGLNSNYQVLSAVAIISFIVSTVNYIQKLPRAKQALSSLGLD